MDHLNNGNFVCLDARQITELPGLIELDSYYQNLSL